MSIVVTPSPDDINKAFGTFLETFLPSGITVQQGQANRVAEPRADDFVVFWPIARTSLATNLDEFIDGVFTGAIAGDTMTISAVDPDFAERLRVGSQVFGVGVADDTVVTAFGTGTGGVGTYIVSPTQTVPSRKLAAGAEELTRSVQITYQVDVHGPNGDQNAHLITTFFRDPRGVDVMQTINPYMVPLEADDAVQLPFVNEQNQYEDRYTLSTRFQVNITSSIGQQFADQLAVDAIIDIDVAYPPQ